MCLLHLSVLSHWLCTSWSMQSSLPVGFHVNSECKWYLLFQKHFIVPNHHMKWYHIPTVLWSPCSCSLIFQPLGTEAALGTPRWWALSRCTASLGYIWKKVFFWLPIVCLSNGFSRFFFTVSNIWNVCSQFLNYGTSLSILIFIAALICGTKHSQCLM